MGILETGADHGQQRQMLKGLPTVDPASQAGFKMLGIKALNAPDGCGI